MKSYLTHLECTHCGETQSADKPAGTCRVCGKVLFARYDLDGVKNAVSREGLRDRPPNMWRYYEVLPVRDDSKVISLDEGYTPIFTVERLGRKIGAHRLLLKDEGLNPTGCFKARGMSAAVSRAWELGLDRLIVPTAGNAGGALASYAARAGLEARVFMPRDAQASNIKEVVSTGSKLTLVDGLISDAGNRSREVAEADGLFDLSTLREPYRAEGKKTMGYEIAEQMGWQMPDAIIYPTGGGTGIIGIWKAIDEMEKLGWIKGKRPRMFCVQAEGCAPIVRAFHKDAEFAEPWEDAQTVASGMRVPTAIGDYLILGALRESGGGAITVSDQQMIDYMSMIASCEGLLVCPEGAATAVGAKKLLENRILSDDDTILLLNTATGMKYLDLL